MAYSRAMSSIALAAMCCFAVFAVVNYGRTSIKLSGDEVVPETEEVDVLKNIIDLKAYCLAAYDNSNIIAQNHPKVQAIADFVHTFGINGGGDDVGGRVAEVDNIGKPSTTLPRADVDGSMCPRSHRVRPSYGCPQGQVWPR